MDLTEEKRDGIRQGRAIGRVKEDGISRDCLKKDRETFEFQSLCLSFHLFDLFLSGSFPDPAICPCGRTTALPLRPFSASEP